MRVRAIQLLQNYIAMLIKSYNESHDRVQGLHWFRAVYLGPSILDIFGTLDSTVLFSMSSKTKVRQNDRNDKLGLK